MKVFFFISLILVTFTINTSGFEIKPLSQIGEEDTGALELITGQWVIGDTRFIHHYTGHFAVRIDGLKYYLYKRLQANSRFPHVYTIVKSKKTGRSYFARGTYENGRFIGTTSRIVFEANDRFVVYSQKDSQKVYFQAARVKKQQDPVRENKKFFGGPGGALRAIFVRRLRRGNKAPGNFFFFSPKALKTSPKDTNSIYN